VLVRGTKKLFLKWIGRALKQKRIRFPESNEPVRWKPIPQFSFELVRPTWKTGTFRKQAKRVPPSRWSGRTCSKTRQHQRVNHHSSDVHPLPPRPHLPVTQPPAILHSRQAKRRRPLLNRTLRDRDGLVEALNERIVPRLGSVPPGSCLHASVLGRGRKQPAFAARFPLCCRRLLNSRIAISGLIPAFPLTTLLRACRVTLSTFAPSVNAQAHSLKAIVPHNLAGVDGILHGHGFFLLFSGSRSTQRPGHGRLQTGI